MRPRFRVLAFLSGLLVLILALCVLSPFLFHRNPTEPGTEEAGGQTGARKKKWAWARKLERPGLANLHQLSEDLYRGAQPDPKEIGLAELRKLGVKTVVNLRSLHGEGDEVAEAGLGYERINFNPLRAPDDEEVLSFLKIATDKKRTPVFVHCKHGADRTGTMCAAYRVVVQGWPKTEAVKEMKGGGFNFHEKYYQGYARYIMDMDVEEVKRKLVGD
jgi:protein tyrosine/serine phosphatase